MCRAHLVVKGDPTRRSLGPSSCSIDNVFVLLVVVVESPTLQKAEEWALPQLKATRTLSSLSIGNCRITAPITIALLKGSDTVVVLCMNAYYEDGALSIVR